MVEFKTIAQSVAHYFKANKLADHGISIVLNFDTYADGDRFMRLLRDEFQNDLHSVRAVAAYNAAVKIAGISFVISGPDRLPSTFDLTQKKWPDVRNVPMRTKLEQGRCIDVSNMPACGGGYILPGFIADVDYCNAVTERWVWSIGRRHADGVILASHSAEFYQNSNFECLWLR